VSGKFGSAVILCGGKSSRLGFDKFNIKVKGKPLYEVMAEELKELFEEIIIVTSKSKKLENKKYLVVEDLIAECGPMGGITTGLQYASSEFVFFIACDMPVINLQVIKSFISKLSEEAFDGVVGKNRGFIEPLYSFYSKVLIDKLNKDILLGNFQMNKFIRNENIYLADEAEWRKYCKQDIYSNINYIEDLDILEKLFGQGNY
jgi:molybdenum cofactor guanylyltransferase